MATPLANFFTRIGFEVDKSSIKDVEKNLERLESRIKSMANSFQSITNAPAVRAATRLANAEARRISAEMNLNRQNMSVEKLKQQNILEGTRLERNKQMTAKVIEQSRLQELRNKAKEFRQQHQASRVRVNNHGGMSFGIPMDSVKGAVGAVAGIEVLRRFTAQSFNVANFQIGQQPQFEFITGSAEEAQKQISFVNNEVDRLSLNLQAANMQYRQLLASTQKTLGIEQTQKLFSSFQNLATMQGLSTDAQNRAIKAFSQMAAKGQIMAEELKGQLAESLPAAVQIFADALTDGDVAKLFDEMENGRLKIDALNKVIEHMATLTNEDLLGKMMNTPAKALERLSTAWQRFIIEVNSAGLTDVMVFALNTLADGVVLLTKVFKPLVSIVKQVSGYFSDLWNLLYTLGSVVLGKVMFNSVGSSTLSFLLFGLTIQKFAGKVLRVLPLLATKKNLLMKIAPLATKAALAIQFLWKSLKFVGIGSFLLLLDDLIVTLQGGDSVLGDLAKGDGWPATLAKSLIAVGRAVEFVLGSFISLFHGITTGDWGYMSEVWNKFKTDMLDLFPFDMWMQEWGKIINLILAAGRLALNPLSPVAMKGLYDAYQSYEKFGYMKEMSMTGFNPVSAAMAPANLARQNPNVTTHMNVTIPINGTGLDPQAISKAVAEQLNITFMQSQSNYVMRNGAK